jgi:Domain of unknown function (DUF4386)
MTYRGMIVTGGVSFIIGAVSFVLVFSYLAMNFSYPDILDGSAADVLPRLLSGGKTMRATWAVYAFLPLFLLPAAVSTYLSCPASRDRMTLALVLVSVGTLAMCLGLMRWPSVHWALAEAYGQADASAKSSIAGIFAGLNLYLGNYIGEFLGETCLAAFFFLAGKSMLKEAAFPRWLGWCGVLFATLFFVGAFRNVTGIAQPIADLNNALLPLWMIVMGVSLIRFGRYDAQPGTPADGPRAARSARG